MAAPLWHVARLRRSEDREFLRPGLCDALLINANQLENNPEGTTGYLEATGLPYMVDPMLWRLQVPDWWRNARGDVKRNYRRLAARYAEGTTVRMAEAPLLESVNDDHEWRRLAQNIVTYQLERLSEQVGLFNADGVRPQAIVAPAVVPFNTNEDRINRLLAETSIEAAAAQVFAMLTLPRERLLAERDVASALREAAADSVAGYLVWTPGVTEELLLSDPDAFDALLAIISALAERGVPIVHTHGCYTTAALHDVGVAGVVHHLGWVDRGEPVMEMRGAARSCRTYVPGVRHTVRFAEAGQMGRSLDRAEYLHQYCDCRFCVGVFDTGQHPLDLLLEDQELQRQARRTPTSRATAANMWHYINARRQEVEAFSGNQALDVVGRDVERAGSLVGSVPALEQLAARLRSA